MSRADVDQVRRALMYRVQTEGVLAAYEAALAICKDPEAPAQARATASSILVRMSGWEKSTDEDLDEKPLYEMTAAELAAKADHLERRLETLGRIAEEQPDLKSDVLS
jgi:hypothetical protein